MPRTPWWLLPSQAEIRGPMSVRKTQEETHKGLMPAGALPKLGSLTHLSGSAHLFSQASTAGSPASTACRTSRTFSSSQLIMAGSFQRKCDLPRYRLTSWLRAGGWLWKSKETRPLTELHGGQREIQEKPSALD